MQILNLNFMHPQYGTIFNADVDTAFTAAEMLENLVLSGFISENKEGWLLALRQQVMQAKQPLATLDGLEEGSVLRILAPEKKSIPQQKILLRHPRSGVYAPVTIFLEENAAQSIQRLQTQGFLSEISEGLTFYFKGQALDATQAFQTFNLPDDAFVELRDAQTQAPDAQLSNLLLAVDSLQSSTQNKLQEILDYLPPPSAIPIDPQRSVNPTLEAFESMDDICHNIYTWAGVERPKRIRIWNPWPLILLGLILLIAITLMVIQFVV